MSISDIIAIAFLVFGFGFVVFFHELGHFLAAKWVGIKIEQFAIGFGHAICAWRKGMRWRAGTTTPEYEKQLKEHVDAGRRKSPSGDKSDPTATELSAAADALGLGDTEYRFNWVPLGGYVKMLGQDDMNPNAQAEDPRAFNKKSIGARMLVVSAGVIMNVILGAILFSVVFLIGFKVPPAIVGAIMTGSPAQKAGLQVGDKVLYLNGEYQHDYTKLHLNTALLPAGQDAQVVFERNGKRMETTVRVQNAMTEAGQFLSLGTGPSAIVELRGPDSKHAGSVDKSADPSSEILPGDVITAINGEKVNDPKRDYPIFDRHVQESGGKPVELTVRNANDGKQRTVHAKVRFEGFFGDTPPNLVGLQPRPVVASIRDKSPVAGKLKEGDILAEVKINGELSANPSRDQFTKLVSKAGDEKRKVGFVVERDGKRVAIDEVLPDFRTGPGKRGVGIGLVIDDEHPVVSGVLKDSPAEQAKIPGGARILKIDGQEVRNWFDIHQLLKKSGGTSVVTYMPMQEGAPVGQKPVEATMRLSEQDRKQLADVRYAHELLLEVRVDIRKTSNPFTGAAWGVTETRDMLLQFYVTLRRLFQGSVPASGLMGPIGIVHAGSMFAMRGADWLIWFLAMISANLAVVNFLPIPIVDGGLFAFLIIEKISGRPLSPRMQTAAQMVGLAIILSVFLLVTYQDIARLWM